MRMRAPGGVALQGRATWPHLVVHGVPGDAVDGPAVAGQHRDRLVPADVEDVDLVVLRARGYKRLVEAAEATVDCVESLGDPYELPNQGPGTVPL
jgi:hypothetical protein